MTDEQFQTLYAMLEAILSVLSRIDENNWQGLRAIEGKIK